MKFGIILPQGASDPKDVLKAAQMAEDRGLDSVWVVDNLEQRPDREAPFLEAWVALSAVAAATTSIQIGTMVLRVSLRNPHLLVSMAETLNRIAPKRLILGLGTGDSSSREQHVAYGIPFLKRNVRYEMLGEVVSCLKEGLNEVSLWVAGDSPPIISLLSKADGWVCWGPSSEFKRHAVAAERGAQGRRVGLNWAGRWRDFDYPLLKEAGADHIVVGTGALNYASRIHELERLRGGA